MSLRDPMFFLTQAQLEALADLHRGRQGRWSNKLVKSLVSRSLVHAPALEQSAEPLKLTRLGEAAGLLAAILSSPAETVEDVAERPT